MRNNEDPGNWSKLERGKLPPPQNPDRLATIAGYFKIKAGTEGWQTLHDLADAEKGSIPADIMADEQVVKKLPIFFRALRGEKISREVLEEIIKITRET
ncbi:hypothetical protein KKB99_02735 [bacterium]|nr:hypothetical protein [bacterium]MBU1024904.1 hypothetical protein [bacterium]